MALLDGKEVLDNVIDPAKHKFVGMFRKPFLEYGCNKPGHIPGFIHCGCGQALQTMEASLAHWRLGHWDELQYVTIEKEKEPKKISSCVGKEHLSDFPEEFGKEK
jgi:hypothetical protein